MRWLLRETWMGLGAAVCVLAYLFPYFYVPGVWWRAIPSTGVILLVGAMFYGRQAPDLFGLRMSRRQLAVSVILFLVLVPIFSSLLSHFVVNEPLTAERHFYPANQVHQFFQVLNDEMLLRAALITVVLRAVPHPKIVTIVLALLFSIGHHLVYRLSSIEIDWPAMVTLFSFGAIANTLFVGYRHIGYGFALHYAWNFFRFNTTYSLNGVRLNEGVTFNYIEGNPWVAGAAFSTCLFVSLAYSHSLRRT
jgi:hypothetical protein